MPASFSMLSTRLFSENPLKSKPIPQFDSTNYLALISRTCSTGIHCQTFSDSWVEQNFNFGVLAARLHRCKDTRNYCVHFRTKILQTFIQTKVKNLIINVVKCPQLKPILHKIKLKLDKSTSRWAVPMSCRGLEAPVEFISIKYLFVKSRGGAPMQKLWG